jgi:acyl-CoA thioester hydrolase
MPNEMKLPFEVELDFSVRTYDIDFAGIVSNIVYIRWLEDLRLTILEEYYPLENFLSKGLVPTLVETHIKYIRPITIADQPHAHMWIGRMTKLKLVFSAEFNINGEITTSSEQLGCLVDVSNGRPAPIPDDLYSEYQKYESVNQ